MPFIATAPPAVSELAERTGLAERYVREWALAQAANGYIVSMRSKSDSA